MVSVHGFAKAACHAVGVRADSFTTKMCTQAVMSIVTDGSQIDGYINSGAVIYCGKM
jgi:hypothetical protein